MQSKIEGTEEDFINIFPFSGNAPFTFYGKYYNTQDVFKEILRVLLNPIPPAIIKVL